MIPPLDPFALHFDSIEIDPARAPSAAAIDHALALCAPAAAAPDLATPGFFLIDDAGGRFEVDRDMGIVSLKDETLFAREHGAIHPVHMRVVEASGASYDLHMQLRITGRVPQMVGSEDLAFIAGIEAPDTFAEPAPAPVVASQPVIASAPTAVISWTRYSASLAAYGKSELARTRRAFISPEMPSVPFTSLSLGLNETLPAVGLPGHWSL